jgi:hypothetical protein
MIILELKAGQLTDILHLFLEEAVRLLFWLTWPIPAADMNMF